MVNRNDVEPESYAEAARIRKIVKFVDLFELGGMESDAVKRMDNDQWRLVALCLGCSVPLEIARNLIVQILHDRIALSSLRVNKAMARSILGPIKSLDKKRTTKATE